MTRARTRLILIAAAFAAIAPPTAAATLAEMIAERVERDYGAVLPDGRLKVQVMSNARMRASEIADLSYDSQTGRFIAIVRHGRRAARVFGRAYAEVPVSVPSRVIRPGETVKPSDLTVTHIDSSRLPPEAVVHRGDLIGNEARRTLSAGRVVTGNLIGPPTLVERNTPVTITFRQSGLKILGKGKALEDGGLGELVRVMNIESKRVIEAEVTGAGEVDISL